MRTVYILKGFRRKSYGWFHGFFTVADEDSTDPMAIIEFKNGACGTFHVRDFKFIDPPNDSLKELENGGQA